MLFTLPSVIMMIFTSIYSVVDGFFISNFVGKTEFAAINLIMPFTQILGCIGFMFGSGGSALVSKTLGEGDRKRASRIFSLLVYIALALGVLLSVLGIIFLPLIAKLMGASDAMLPFCVTYGRILLATLPAIMMQNMFQAFLVTAEKPTLGLFVTVAAGLTNMCLDALFIVVFEWEIVGAAVATSIAQIVGGVIPFVYFARKNTSLLKLCKTSFDKKAVFDACTNGSSELVSNISMSVVSILYNFKLMELAGEDGVAAYGAVMYVSFIFIAVFLGYSVGVAPVIGFHYGAGNKSELRGLLRRSLIMVGIAAAALAAVSFGLSETLARFFLGAETVEQNPKLLGMTIDAFEFFALSTLFSGFSIFGSAFFTALGNGGVSAAISFLRTMLFQIAAVLILPIIFGLDGIWYSFFASELFAMLVTVAFLIGMRKKYEY